MRGLILAMLALNVWFFVFGILTDFRAWVTAMSAAAASVMLALWLRDP